MTPRLSDVQADALNRLEPRRWLGTRETGVEGSTIVALDRKGLVKAAQTRRPYRRIVGKLTPAGVRARRDLELKRLGAAALEDLTIGDLTAAYVLGDFDRRRAIVAELARRGRKAAEDEDARTIATLAVLYLEQAHEDAQRSARGRAVTNVELAERKLAELILEREPDDADVERIVAALELAQGIGGIVKRGRYGWRLEVGR